MPVVNLIGLESTKTNYEVNEYLGKSWKACKETWSAEKTPYIDYFIHEGDLFKGHLLCIPRASIQENLIRE